MKIRQHSKYKIFIFIITIINCISLWIALLSWLIPYLLSFVKPEILNIEKDWLEMPITFFGYQWWHYIILSVILIFTPAILSLYGIESEEVKKLKENEKNKKTLSK